MGWTVFPSPTKAFGTLVAKPVNVTSFRSRVFADQVKLIKVAWHPVEHCSYKRRNLDINIYTQREHRVKMKAEIMVMQ